VLPDVALEQNHFKLMVPDPKKGPQENPAGLESVYK